MFSEVQFLVCCRRFSAIPSEEGTTDFLEVVLWESFLSMSFECYQQLAISTSANKRFSSFSDCD